MQTEQINKQLDIKIVRSRAYIGLRNYFCVDIEYETYYPNSATHLVGGGTLHLWYDGSSNCWRKESNDNTIEDLVLKNWIAGMEEGHCTYKNN